MNHKIFFFIFSGITAAIFAACASVPAPPALPGTVLQSNLKQDMHPDASLSDLKMAVAGNQDFTLDFYQAVRSQPGNLFFSPYSLYSALGMAYAGARGETERQMADALHYGLAQEKLHAALNSLDLQINSTAKKNPPADDPLPFQLRSANTLWGQKDYSFLPAYLDVLSRNYGAGMHVVDFARDPEAARLEINDWVYQQTEERIKDLVPPDGVSSATRLALVNAIYFKADWAFPFEPSSTREIPFIKLDGSQVDVPMMSFLKWTNLLHTSGDGFQALELPYVGEGVVMNVIVPDKGRFEEFESKLDSGVLNDIFESMQPAVISLVLPKFEFSSSFRLSDTLAEMGMEDAFNPGAADFSGIDGKGELSIGEVFHKAFVAVDEKGTEAAAATAIIMEAMSAMNEPDVRLVVDRPFIFLIRDKSSGAILFLGRLTDPRNE